MQAEKCVAPKKYCGRVGGLTEMEERVKTQIIGAVVGALLCYLGVAFCVWDYNPANWEPASRFGLVMALAIFAPLGAWMAEDAAHD